LDLQDLDSVVECVNEFKKMKIPLDILINNAGVGKNQIIHHLGHPLNKPKSTKQNYEIMFGVNYLGHFLLDYVLLHLNNQSCY
jgi:NAD(P)-dependent dehydrogenase (short-subunit alcohol dehydrogenase family)